MAPSNFTELFGKTLLTKDGEKPTADVVAGCDAVGVYFSAHWCGPCRRFTPELTKVYEQLRADGKKFEIIFVSSDQDQAAFDEYYGSMPWTALPYGERDTKASLSKKYKVSGIPTLVILNADAATITKDGRSAVGNPEKFPWIPPSLGELLAGPFADPTGAEVLGASLSDKYVGLYFSAHWCGPCRAFTPQLSATYRTMKEAGVDNFEIVFVSSDQDEAAFKEYHGEMPWLALPYANRDAKSALSARFEVRGIPSLVILGPEQGGTREVINGDARGVVGSDPKGANFPWAPPPLPKLEESTGINDTATVVIMADGCSPEKVAAIRSEVEPVAKKAKEAAKAAGSDAAVAFALAEPGDDLAGRVRTLCKIGEPEAAAKVMLLDLGDDGGWYLGEDDATSAAAITTFVEAYKAKQLERKQLQ